MLETKKLQFFWLTVYLKIGKGANCVIHDDVFWTYLGYNFPKDSKKTPLIHFNGRNAVVAEIFGTPFMEKVSCEKWTSHLNYA